jgi:hypothetical protein
VNIKLALEIVRLKLQEHGSQLNDLQETILRRSLEGKTYGEIAEKSEYSHAHIRSVGADLFQKLSQAFEQKLTKNNLRSVLKNYSYLRTLTNQRHQPSSTVTDFGKVIDIPAFYGRNQELRNLSQAILEHHCRLTSIFGMKGIGKTTLSIQLTQQILESFEFVSWQSLDSFSSFKELIQHDLKLFPTQDSIEPLKKVTTQIYSLISCFKKYRCLFVLDDFETVLSPHPNQENTQENPYLQLLQHISQENHQSCFVIVSQRQPEIIEQLLIHNPYIYTQQLRGLTLEASWMLIRNQIDTTSSQQDWQTLYNYYDGNPLILKIVASIIQEYFGGSLKEFVTYLQYEPILFDEIKNLLLPQLNSLTPEDQSVMYWLAIRQRVRSVEELSDLMVDLQQPQEIATILRSLKRRSLVERDGDGFTQQPVIREYLIYLLVERITQEIFTQELNLLKTHSLLQPEAQDALQQDQIQSLIKPILQQIRSTFQNPARHLNRVLYRLQNQTLTPGGYGEENLLHLLHYNEIIK